jgi:hypothetical protein
VRQICFSAALICAALPDPAMSHRWLSWAFSSAVSAVVESFWISALQTATSAGPPPGGIAGSPELGVVGVVVWLLLVVEEVRRVELVLVVVVALAAFDEVLLEVVAAALVVLALLVVVVVVVGLLPPQAATIAPLTTAPTSSRYSLRVILHPLGCDRTPEESGPVVAA